MRLQQELAQASLAIGVDFVASGEAANDFLAEQLGAHAYQRFSAQALEITNPLGLTLGRLKSRVFSKSSQRETLRPSALRKLELNVVLVTTGGQKVLLPLAEAGEERYRHLMIDGAWQHAAVVGNLRPAVRNSFRHQHAARVAKAVETGQIVSDWSYQQLERADTAVLMVFERKQLGSIAATLLTKTVDQNLFEGTVALPQVHERQLVRDVFEAHSDLLGKKVNRMGNFAIRALYYLIDGNSYGQYSPVSRGTRVVPSRERLLHAAQPAKLDY